MEFLPGGVIVAWRRPGTIWSVFGCRKFCVLLEDVYFTNPVMNWKKNQLWAVSGVKFLQSPSHIKTITLRNHFKAANGGTMTTDFLIRDDFIENVDSGLYELKLFSLIYF